MTDQPESTEDAQTHSWLPKYAVLGTIGRVQILSYDGNGYFTVLDCRDVRRFVPRWRLTFLP